MYFHFLRLITCAKPAKSGLLDIEFFQGPFPCFCNTYVFPWRSYVTALGLLGVLVTALQICQVLADGQILTNKPLPMYVTRPVLLDETTFRDLKLIFTVLELTIYCCLVLGGYWRLQNFLLPWIITKTTLVLVTVLLASWRFVLQRPMTLSTLGLISLMIELHNFLYVLCLFVDISQEYNKK
ncbi:hypothetical protein J6590_043922 [Homalodisca vitripennis]|nr:hypothetical protein J6590_043922 [Homalodisca vitripennis]